MDYRRMPIEIESPESSVDNLSTAATEAGAG